MRSALMYSCMPNPSEAPMSVALMSCLLCVDATEPCPRLAPAGESARSPFWFSRDISRRSAGDFDPRVRDGLGSTHSLLMPTGLQISRPRAFSGTFRVRKSVAKSHVSPFHNAPSSLHRHVRFHRRLQPHLPRRPSQGARRPPHRAPRDRGQGLRGARGRARPRGPAAPRFPPPSPSRRPSPSPAPRAPTSRAPVRRS